MKIALVHDYLCGYGGSERIFEYMCQEFKEADIYTLSYNKSKTLPEYKSYNINTTFLNTFVRSMESFRWSFPMATYAMENINLSKYDIVLSSSATVAKYVNVPNGIHICYCYIPTRALWQKDAYFNKSWKKHLISPFLNYLKNRDLEAASKVNFFISQSMDTQSHIKNIYKKDSDIINGPINTSLFKPHLGNRNSKKYLLVSRLENWKKVDYAIDAFNLLKLPLRIVGTGRESSRLIKKANKNIEFLGTISDEKLAEEYSQAKAVIFTPYLEYGLIPLEANACGTPVIAYGKGGIEETMIPYKGNESESTAIFFYEQNTEELIKAIQKFENIKFNKDFIINHAKKWSIPAFKAKLREYVNLKKLNVSDVQ